MKKLRIFLANIGLFRAGFPLVTPPMGLLCLAGYLRTKFDLDIRIVNQRAERYSNEELLRRIIEFQPDVVGFETLTPNAHLLPPLTAGVRTALPKSLILLGGPHITAFGIQALEDSAADAAVAGEGELSFEQILNAFLGGADFSAVPGLMWRDREGQLITNPGEAPVVDDLDSLPFPAYDLIDVRSYWRRQSMPPIPRRKYISLFSSRGCPYRCSWCHRIFGRRFRAHSAERIVDEIEQYVRTYGVDDIEFLDDIFNQDRKRLTRFCELVAQRNLRIKIAFPNAIRADVLTEGDVEALRGAGTYYSAFALESGSPRIQEHTGKRLNIPRFLQGVEMAVKRGIFANGFVMLGFPTETEEEMKQTIDVTCGSSLHTVSFFTVTPFPNTPLYDFVMKTHPEKLAGISYADAEYTLIPANFSEVPDSVFFYYRRKANRQFFLNPRRIYRILRDFPQPHLLPYYLPTFINRITKGLL